MRLGDRKTEAHAESTLGLLNSLLGLFPTALVHLTRAVALGRELETPRAESESLTILSTLFEQWGRYAEAAAAARRAVDLDQRIGNRDSEVVSRTDLALALVGLRDLAGARECLEMARRLCDDAQDPGDVAVLLALSADVDLLLGHDRAASRHARRAEELIPLSAVPVRRVKAANILGRLRRRCGDNVTALDLHGDALDTATTIGYRIEQAYAFAGLASAAHALGEPAAKDYQQSAAEVFLAMDLPAGGHRR